MVSRVALALGAATATFFVVRSTRASLAGSGGLAGLGAARGRGIDGSPFEVNCDLDQECFRQQMDLELGNKRSEHWRRLYGTAEEEATVDCTQCIWGCVDSSEVRVARFRDRMNPEEYAYLARSPKPGGGWQVSWFDERGPRGDARRDTQCAAVRELSSGYKYYGRKHRVEGQIMSNWYLEEWA